MLIHAGELAEFGNTTYRIRCPGCRDRVTLDAIGRNDTELRSTEGRFRVGERRCPQCKAFVVVVGSDSGTVLATFPAETIEFDTVGIPESIVAAFDEAVRCHAQECYVAAAIMVRKTLEELCREHKATGANLKARIASLGQQIVLPKALLDGLDDLRLLGNDAAHVESQTYNQVGKEEVEVAMDVAKEILKATYQLDSIVARLQALKVAHEEQGT